MHARLVFVCFVVCRRPLTLPTQPWRTLGCACDTEHHGRDATAKLNEWAEQQTGMQPLAGAQHYRHRSQLRTPRPPARYRRSK